jgi:hypothetical protein
MSAAWIDVPGLDWLTDARERPGKRTSAVRTPKKSLLMLAALNVVTLETLPPIVSVNCKVADPYTERGFRCFLRALLVDLVRPRQEMGHVIGVGVARHDAVRHVRLDLPDGDGGWGR